MKDSKNSYNWPEYLTVGQLKEQLANLPDDLPVFYQHIDDSYMWKSPGWKENAVRRRDERETIENAEEWTDEWYHRAFASFKTKTIDDKEILAITAHY